MSPHTPSNDGLTTSDVYVQTRTAVPRPVAFAKPQPALRSQVRRYADQAPQAGNESGGGGNNQMLIVLAAIVALGAGGWYYLKPVRDVAHATHQTIDSVKNQGEGLVRMIHLSRATGIERLGMG